METTIEKKWTHGGLDCMVVHVFGEHYCGYVNIPDEHPWCGVQTFEHHESGPKPATRDLEREKFATWTDWYRAQEKPEDYCDRLESQIDVHGGLTFAGQFNPDFAQGWWMGFDCNHLHDWSRGWDVDSVSFQVEKLADQVLAAGGIKVPL